jgi:hypothetical protein
MALDARRHVVPAPTEAPRRAAFDDLSLSVRDIVYVADVADRDQLVADLTAAGLGPAADRPLYVHRADLPGLEWSTDAQTWHQVPPPPVPEYSAVVQFPPANATAHQLAITFPAGLFTDPPAVTTSVQSTAATDNVVTHAFGVTATGCTVRMANTAGASFNNAGRYVAVHARQLTATT